MQYSQLHLYSGSDIPNLSLLSIPLLFGVKVILLVCIHGAFCGISLFWLLVSSFIGPMALFPGFYAFYEEYALPEIVADMPFHRFYDVPLVFQPFL